MQTARLIVCERSSQWAVALRRAMVGDPLRVYETRSLPDCWRELADHPASLLVIELTRENAKAVMASLISLHKDYAAARAIVVSGRHMQPYEWLLREAGALHVLFSPRKIASAVLLARRHLARVPQAQETSLAAVLWSRLPWAE